MTILGKSCEIPNEKPIFKDIAAMFIKNDGLFNIIRGIFRIFTPKIKLLS